MSRPAVVFGGPSPEHDISILTGLQAARALVDGGEDVDAIYWTKAAGWYLVDPRSEAVDFLDGPPKRAKELRFVAEPGEGWLLRRRALAPSAVVNCCHGGPGEDGRLQGALDLAGIRYTGPDAAASMLGMDKYAFGAVVRGAGLPSLPRHLLTADGIAAVDGAIEPPFIVKPRFGGSSIGIEVVADVETALALLRSSPHLRRGAVVEPFLPQARDLNIAVRTYPELELSAIEAPARSGDGAIYDYRQKYLSGGGLEGSAREVPASIPDALADRIRDLARRVVDLVGLRGIARIDFLEFDGDVWINEVNTIPGSLAAYLWVDPPIERARLLRDMIAEALADPGTPFGVEGADGTALRSAASIAAKLG